VRVNYIEQTAELIRANLDPDMLPEHSYPLMLMYAVLARVKGAETTLEDVHDAWSAWMSMRDSRHESIVPFADLPEDVRREDEPFLRAILDAL
jgi:hypothetical protein